MNPRRRTYLRFLIVFMVLGSSGLTATAYLLIKERAPVPFQDVYTVKAELTSADAIVGGLGQPVNVVGVKVGQVTGTKLVDGRAVVTLQIQRDQVPRLYRNATAVLEPVTPLNDMQVELDPGTPTAAPMRPGDVLGVRQTAPPVPLSDLLRTLDGDTRAYLTSLIASAGQGFGDRGPDLRRMLRALGPTTHQAGLIARAAAARRTALARLVHSLAQVTTAATQDRQLASLIAAGNQTLKTIAVQDRPLHDALKNLPPTLDLTRTTLKHLEPLAAKLDPTLTSLMPAVRALPGTLSQVKPFAEEATVALRRNIRPFVRAASPLARKLAPTVTTLTPTTPRLTRAFQILTYAANELAYNPDPGGKNRGFLYWLAWGMHNLNSVISVGDAHGGIARSQLMFTCSGVAQTQQLRPLLDLLDVCPK
jgi:phospholipid/cholesterol/gamma-HCH transport system substrate-binding protein